jgi:hypothetical protein
MEALQVPKFVAIDFAEALVELVVWEVAVGVRVPDMAARLDVIWRSQWQVLFPSSKMLTHSIHIRNSRCGKRKSTARKVGINE